MYGGVIELAKSALRSALLINAGAAIAALSFLGSIWSTAQWEVTSPIIHSLKSFSFGVALVAMASGIAFLIQRFYYDAAWKEDDCRRRIADVLMWVAGLLLVGSYLFFVCGVLSAASGLEKQG